MDAETAEGYVVNRTIRDKWDSTVHEHETLGVFDNIKGANKAAPRLLRQDHDIELEENDVKISPNGCISIHVDDGDFTFDLEVQKSKRYKPKIQPVEAPRRNEMITDQGIYIVERTISGNYIDSTSEIIGTFASIEEANKATSRLWEQGYEGTHWEDYEETVLEDGSLSIHATGDDTVYFDIIIRRVNKGAMADKVRAVQARPPTSIPQAKSVFVVQEEQEWYSSGPVILTSMAILGVFRDLIAANACVRKWGDSHHNHEDGVDEDDEDDDDEDGFGDECPNEYTEDGKLRMCMGSEDGKYHQGTTVRVVEERLQ